MDVGRNDVVPGDTTFSAVLFQTFYHPGSMVERYGGEAADTGLGCKNAHLPPCLGKSDKLMLIVMSKDK